MSYPDLTNFRALSFDCFGTLIDWETGLLSDLSPVLSKLPPSHPWSSNPALALKEFNAHSQHLWATQPTLIYPANLTQSMLLLAADANITLDPSEAQGIASGPGRWAAFSDTVAALATLKKRYKLIILSNVDNDNISRTVAGALGGTPFDGVYTAEEIGSYKPDLKNFHYLFARAKKELDVDWEKGELLHVARGLAVDHVAAKKLGLRSAWIARGGDDPKKFGVGGDLHGLLERGEVAFEWKFQTLGDMADEVERQFAEKEGK